MTYIVAESPGLAGVDGVGHVLAVLGGVDVEPLRVDLALVRQPAIGHAAKVRCAEGVGGAVEAVRSESKQDISLIIVRTPLPNTDVYRSVRQVPHVADEGDITALAFPHLQFSIWVSPRRGTHALR